MLITEVFGTCFNLAAPSPGPCLHHYLHHPLILLPSSQNGSPPSSRAGSTLGTSFGSGCAEVEPPALCELGEHTTVEPHFHPSSLGTLHSLLARAYSLGSCGTLQRRPYSLMASMCIACLTHWGQTIMSGNAVQFVCCYSFLYPQCPEWS